MEEIVALVDEEDRIIGKTPRKDIHAERKLHRETSVFIRNVRNEILLQKRQDTGLWDYSASGHMPWEETYGQGIVRETEEELGVRLPFSAFKPILKRRIRTKGNDRFVMLFEVVGEYPLTQFTPNHNNVKNLAYFSPAELRKMLEKEPGQLTQGFTIILERYLNHLQKSL